MVRSGTQHPSVAAHSAWHTHAALRRVISSDFGIGLIIALSWQIIMTVIGVYFAMRSGSPSVSDAFVSHMNHWDAGWYRHVLAYAYGPQGSPAAPAFYPLFPVLVGLVSFLSFGLIDHVVAGLLVNTAALWLALVALLRILRNFTSSRSAITLGVALFLCFPAAFFMHVFYGEAVFVAVGLWAYTFALQRRWWAVGALLAALSAARLPAVLFMALCLLEYLRAYDWKIKKAFNPHVLWFLLAPLGFLVYGTYLTVVRHDFFAMFHAYTATNDWTYQVFSPNIFATIGDAFSTVIGAVISHQFTYDIFVNQLVPLVALATLIVSSIYCLRLPKSRGVPLGIVGLLATVMFTLNSNVVSVHRYILPCVVIYAAAATWRRASWQGITLWCMAAACLALQLYLYMKFIGNMFAG